MINRFLLASTVVLAVVLSVVLFDPSVRPTEEVQASRDNSAGYQFTNPILDYENVKMEAISLISNDVSKKVMELRKKHGLFFASVYFRDLDNGQWIGVNEKEPFASASLIKLPMLIALFRQKESDSSILDKQVTVSESHLRNDSTQNIKPENPLKVGQAYNLLEVAEKMIEDSDNAGMSILEEQVDNKYRTGIFESIGIAFQPDSRDEVMVNVKNYAGFFRVLFNASYLNREDSEQALQILSKTKFNDGLVSGVPAGVTVAHKFGERANYVNGILESTQLHDCGIVYYPDTPYILCVMTRGNNFLEQEHFISDVSQFFYQQVGKSLSRKR